MRAYCAIFLIKLNSISHTVFVPFLPVPSYFLYINLSAHQQEAVPNVAQHNEIKSKQRQPAEFSGDSRSCSKLNYDAKITQN